MLRTARSAMLFTMVLAAGLLTGCGKKDADDTAATTDTTTVAPAPTPPAELAAASDKFTAGWNAEDDAAEAAMFTDSATVNEDTMHYVGKQQIQEKWIKPSMASIQQLTVTNQVWTPSGADFTNHGNYSLNVVDPKTKKPATVTGTYDATWTKGADGSWKVSTMTIHSDAPPAATSAQ